MNSNRSSHDDDFVLTLSRSEAIVFFEWLATNAEGVQTHDSSERIVLWNLEAQLEKGLVEPLRADYSVLLAEARRGVRESALDNPDTVVDEE